jgi:nanoRNase/pAp phosphatase (c-di-AMP/oligoRNAs hydrolase)
MDPRTGLSRFRNFAADFEELMKNLAQACVTKNIDDILAMPVVKERIEVYKEQSELFSEMIKKHTKIEGNVMFLDLRGVETIHAGNRFLIYTMFPEQNISLWVIDGKDKVNVAITVGYSIINRSAEVNVGSLMLSYGGGGHIQVGTCQIEYADADRVIAEIIEKIK